MNEQELLLKMQEVKKIRLLSRVAVIAALVLVAILYGMGIDIKILAGVLIVFCVVIILGVGLPTQKKLSHYEEQLKKLGE